MRAISFNQQFHNGGGGGIGYGTIGSHQLATLHREAIRESWTIVQLDRTNTNILLSSQGQD